MCQIRRPEGGDDRFLDCQHFFALGGLLVIVAGEVKQAVDEVAEDFAGQGFGEFGGLADGHFRTYDNFAVMERDHVGGPLNVHELTVNPLAGGVVHQGDLDGGEVAQRGILQSRVVDGEGGSLRGDFLEGGEPGFGNIDSLLMVADDDFERHGDGQGGGLAALRQVSTAAEEFLG